MPRVSVLMPAFNVEKYIVESIESILNQTFSDFELIIVDDGSSDNTWKLIQAQMLKDSRIIAHQNEMNLGISPTRNKLIKYATGEFIVWQDADDIALSNRISEQVVLMQQHPEVGVCGGSLEFFNEEGAKSLRAYAADDTSLRATIFRYSPVSLGASIMRRDILLKTSLFDVSLTQAEDLDLSFRLGRISNFANLQTTVLRYRQSGQSISSRKLKENISQTLIVRKKAVLEYGYKMSIADKLVFFVTSVFQYLPSRFTLLIFNLLRNS